ncbi:MAG: hypothetical protein HC797_06765 [Anaerolineales bacterium]|nr:hypothetical protein [Anaerolineales bacterium]
MKKYNIYLAILTLILASFACQTVTGGGSNTSQEELPPFEYSEPETPEEQSGDSDFSFGGESDFPLTSDAQNVINVAGTTNYQTSISLDEVMDFYRDVYGKQGLTERELLTVTSDGVFSMVFDGHASGQAVVIQGVDLGDGTVNVSLRLEDV